MPFTLLDYSLAGKSNIPSEASHIIYCTFQSPNKWYRHSVAYQEIVAEMWLGVMERCRGGDVRAQWDPEDQEGIEQKWMENWGYRVSNSQWHWWNWSWEQHPGRVGPTRVLSDVENNILCSLWLLTRTFECLLPRSLTFPQLARPWPILKGH